MPHSQHAPSFTLLHLLPLATTTTPLKSLQAEVNLWGSWSKDEPMSRNHHDLQRLLPPVKSETAMSEQGILFSDSPLCEMLSFQFVALSFFVWTCNISWQLKNLILLWIGIVDHCEWISLVNCDNWSLWSRTFGYLVFYGIVFCLDIVKVLEEKFIWT